MVQILLLHPVISWNLVKYCFLTTLGLNWLIFKPHLFPLNMRAVFAIFWVKWICQVFSLKKRTLAGFCLNNYCCFLGFGNRKRTSMPALSINWNGRNGLLSRILSSLWSSSSKSKDSRGSFSWISRIFQTISRIQKK